MANKKWSFDIEGGCLKLVGTFPKRMTWKQALEYSIQKWEFIMAMAKKGNVLHWTGGNYTCALCKRSEAVSGTIRCELCPVMKRTGKGACEDTPYYSGDRDTNGVEYAAAEIKFLKSLRKDLK